MSGVVSNLINPPSITLTRDSSEVDSVSGRILTHSLADNSAGEFTCRVCINVPEANIVGYCNETSLTLSTSGECTNLIFYAYIYILTPQYQDSLLQCYMWTMCLRLLLTGAGLTVQI